MSRKYRCTVYTRKSTEDGLEQDFNSLDAQRESCEAYIKSQRHEGWKLLPDRYDDGGVSGGTMERPALRRLLDEVIIGRVDIIVVYKVDRLTRALSDFAKMVDLFDKHDVSFVSVTQQFNTTTSMGRLTLNVLLSFAQFEREVTAERIRDKIAASKKRGMWMGGPVPLGYDSVDKKLVVNEAEAGTVRALFRLYLETGNVRSMKEEADRHGFRSKLRIYKGGRQTGGCRFARGHLYRLLSNPVYIGEVIHKGERYEGTHAAIIDRETWNAAQAQLKRNAANRRAATNARFPSLLSGILWDKEGGRLIPSHACKSGKRYRYYVSAPDDDGFARAGWRLPAREIERVVTDGMASFLSDRASLIDHLPITSASPPVLNDIFKGAAELASRLTNGISAEKKTLLQELVHRIEVGAGQVSIAVSVDRLLGLVKNIDRQSRDAATDQPKLFTLHLPVSFRRRARGEKLLIAASDTSAANPDPQLIRAVARGHSWFREIREGGATSLTELAERHGVERTDAGHIIRLAFLAPDIIEAILQGRQPRDLTFRRLKRLNNLPESWARQRDFLGFPG
jgi:DNA invertase Pin-like site-specific DNA recombinase